MPTPADRSASTSSAPSLRGRRRGAVAAALLAIGWLAGMGVLQWSVVRFRVPIVLTLVGCALALAGWQLRRARVEPTRLTALVVLLGSALLALAVPTFSYLPPVAERWGLILLGGYAVLAGVVLWWSGPDGRGRQRAVRSPGVVAVLAVLVHVVAASIAIVTDPAPRIDVWVTVQQAADALGRGENFYDLTWAGSPGVQDAFTYLPWTAVLLAPGRWLLGDVRWALLAWSLVLYAGLWLLATRPATSATAPTEVSADGADGDDLEGVPVVRDSPATRRWVAALAIAMLALAPGHLTQLDQAWTEPLLAAGVVWWAVLVRRGHPWWAVIPLALACASKQHLAVVLPLLLLWRPFGPVRAVATGALAAALMSPWVIASPTDFLHDTVTLLIGFHAIRFANTLYLLALNVYGVTLPFWVTGLAVLGTLSAASWLIWRRQPGLGELLRWVALVLLVANLVNKQAFYNQFWLCAALVVMSLAAEAGQRRPRAVDAAASAGSAPPPRPR